jgi:uncharacterized membrane protein
MDLGLIEKAGLKGFGWRLKRMKQVKRWLPLIGTAILALAVALRAFGQEDAARAVEQLGGLIGLTGAPTVGMAELLAASAAVTGIVLKVRAELKKPSI